ncbi:uncharacterized protein LOC128211961 isoform X2 [Mya arenaria]|uniref:uncharacterized protein LOC128211961 isoform X2 n=1 Tax=Mya arenaria TaxID=6604 RepID=UPI0022DEB0B3|nr:uncharacterized protein LOC128211961 isoform X2 [Mya arenaria]
MKSQEVGDTCIEAPQETVKRSNWMSKRTKSGSRGMPASPASPVCSELSPGPSPSEPSVGHIVTMVNTTTSDIDENENTSFTEIKERTCSRPASRNGVFNCTASRAELEDSYQDMDKIRLVLLYAWIKEEMSKTAAKSVAGRLYQMNPRQIAHLDLESICHCSWRRDAVELLLKKVLMGPPQIYMTFLICLREEEETCIADKLSQCEPTQLQIQVFHELQLYSLRRGPRLRYDQSPMQLTDSDVQTLLHFLNTRSTIDTLNDHFLSKLLFSIREHNNIVNTSMDSEKRVKELIDTIKLCAEKAFVDFCEICKLIEMEHVLSKLEKRVPSSLACKQRQKRKSTPSTDTKPEGAQQSLTTAKRQCFSSKDELRMVSSLQRSASQVQEALDPLGLALETINKGSIVLQLRLIKPDSLWKLRENCRTGKIKDIIPVVYSKEADVLQQGEYRLKFTIYVLPNPPDSSAEKKVMFHLETDKEDVKDQASHGKKAPPTDHNDNPLEEHMSLLCEELEISKPLLDLLKKKKLVEDDIKEQINKNSGRKNKIKYLLKKLSSDGKLGYSVLKEFIKEENEDLYKELLTRETVNVIDNKMDTAAKVTKNPTQVPGRHRSMHQKQVFFTGTVVLKVNKKGVKSSSGKQDASNAEVEITCPEIIDPTCHFSGEDVDCGSEGITMVIEEDMSLVGGDKQPMREVLVGKRKTKKTSGQDKKRAHSLEETESSETDGDGEKIDLNEETEKKPEGSPDEGDDCDESVESQCSSDKAKKHT